MQSAKHTTSSAGGIVFVFGLAVAADVDIVIKIPFAEDAQGASNRLDRLEEILRFESAGAGFLPRKARSGSFRLEFQAGALERDSDGALRLRISAVYNVAPSAAPINHPQSPTWMMTP